MIFHYQKHTVLNYWSEYIEIQQGKRGNEIQQRMREEERFIKDGETKEIWQGKPGYEDRYSKEEERKSYTVKKEKGREIQERRR